MKGFDLFLDALKLLCCSKKPAVILSCSGGFWKHQPTLWVLAIQKDMRKCLKSIASLARGAGLLTLWEQGLVLTSDGPGRWTSRSWTSFKTHRLWYHNFRKMLDHQLWGAGILEVFSEVAFWHSISPRSIPLVSGEAT